MVTDIEMNDLCNAISAPGILWQPSIMQAFRPVQSQSGWLCVWYKDCGAYTVVQALQEENWMEQAFKSEESKHI